MNDSINWDPIAGAGAYSQDRAYAVSYNRPFITRDGTGRLRARRTTCSAPTMRRSTGSRSRDTTSPTSPASTPTGSGPTTSRTTRRSSRSATMNTGRATSAPMSRKPAMPASTCSSGAATKSTGRPAGRPPTAPTARAYRTLVCYKETLAVADRMPGRRTTTISTRPTSGPGPGCDTRFHGNPLAGGGNPEDVDPITGLNPACHCGENQLIGQLFGPDGTGQFGGALDVPAELRQAAGLARHHRRERRQARHRPGHPRLRMGHVPRRQAAPGRAHQAVGDDDFLGRHPRRPGQHHPPRESRRTTCRSTGRQRRAGLRRRHGVLELGAEQQARQLALRRADREYRHQAVHHEHVRGHGDPAGGRRRHPDLAGSEARQRLERHHAPPWPRSTTCRTSSRRSRPSRSPAPRPTMTATR